MLEVLLGITGRGKLALSGALFDRYRRYEPIFIEVGGGARHGALLAGIAWTESDFVASARNPQSQAAGLMQIMPFHFDRFGWRGGQWADPESNIQAGWTILNDAGLGKDPLRLVLARYGGFVPPVRGPRDNPSIYVQRVVSRATIVFASMWLRGVA